MAARSRGMTTRPRARGAAESTLPDDLADITAELPGTAVGRAGVLGAWALGKVAQFDVGQRVRSGTIRAVTHQPSGTVLTLAAGTGHRTLTLPYGATVRVFDARRNTDPQVTAGA